MALALTELILTRYPKDTLRVGTFGDEAREIAIRDIPYLQVGPFHTNTRAGLEMAQTILESTRQSNRQIFMVTDGKPTAITENGEVYKNPYGFDPKILAQTLEAASACRRAGITITTFMLAQDPELVNFVEEMTKPQQGQGVLRRGRQAGGVPLRRLHQEQEAHAALAGEERRPTRAMVVACSDTSDIFGILSVED